MGHSLSNPPKSTPHIKYHPKRWNVAYVHANITFNYQGNRRKRLNRGTIWTKRETRSRASCAVGRGGADVQGQSAAIRNVKRAPYRPLVPDIVCKVEARNVSDERAIAAAFASLSVGSFICCCSSNKLLQLTSRSCLLNAIRAE